MKKKKTNSQASDQCDPRTGCCKPSSASRLRRDFLKMAVLSTGAFAFPGSAYFAGPFSFNEKDHLIPEDKKLDPEWVKSLYERGEPEKYGKAALKYIGMPVGGIGCGQLYLGGDGRLWFWHIFKTAYGREKDHGQKLSAMTLGGHYVHPEKVFEREKLPIDQGAVIRVSKGGKKHTRILNNLGFPDISFRGEYPIGRVTYRDDTFPVDIHLEAFSPFIPGQLEKSALPVTVLSYKIKNTASQELEVELAGWLENAVCPDLSISSQGVRRNTLIRKDDRITIFSTAEGLATMPKRKYKEDVVFEDFEMGSYHRWKAEGNAFGKTPVTNETKDFPETGVEGKYYVSSFNLRELKGKPNKNTYPWGRITLADRYTGTLTSETFTITHDYITFLISGGYHPRETSLNLLVDGIIIRTQTGDHNGKMQVRFFDVSDYLEKKAKLQIIDNHQGIWGSISVDHIVFTDKKPTEIKLENREGYGSMGWTLYRPSPKSKAVLDLQDGMRPEDILDAFSDIPVPTSSTRPMNKKILSALGEKFTLKPGEEKEVVFILSWYFPYLNEQGSQTGQLLQLKDIKYLNRHYHNWFNSANQVVDFVCRQYDELAGGTRLWNQNYYDSTLPYWLLDRSFIPINCLATNTFLWFDNGRIWAWEGVECCPGTCQHVWQYAQGLARIFPEAERRLREVTDFGISFREDGGFGHRDETAGGYGITVAHDGHCGTIMRVFREHKTSPDNGFLKHHYQKVKKAVHYIINEDKNRDGILENGQANTLDAKWYGPMGWISSMYLGALAAGKEMAIEVGDLDFAQICNEILQRGRKNLVEMLFNGEYFIHKPDPNHPNAINTNTGCHIDQVLGQSFGWQVGLPERIVPEAACKSALESIWKYNFAPDAYLYQQQHKHIKGARIFATIGEAGTIMCTWPKGGAEKAVPGMEERPDNSERWSGPGGYFDETMNGFEYQLASHMIYEGLVEKGLAITRAVHDRYNPLKRNPYNEIECSDHYSRSMASYGVFLAVCGYHYHGPKGYLAFNPKINPEDFKAPFTVAEGWGSFQQKRSPGKQENQLELKFGQLKLNEFEVQLPRGAKPATYRISLNEKTIESNAKLRSKGKYVVFIQEILFAGEVLIFHIEY